MRKAWLLLLVVALTAVSVSAFADTAPAAGWTAWNQGNFYPYASLNGATAVAGWGPNYDGAGSGAGGIDQEWTFAYSGKNYGFNATAEWGSLDAPFGSNNFANISWFATWYKFGDLVKVSLGAPRDNSYTLFTAIDGDNVTRWGDSNWGAYVQIYPVAGLSIGVADYVDGVAVTTAIPGGNGNGYSVAASYAVPQLMTVMAMWKSVTATGLTGGTQSSDIQLGANITAVKGFNISAQIDDNVANSNVTNFNGWASVTTAMDPLKLALDFWLKDLQTQATQVTFMIEGDVQYTLIDIWALGLTIGYDSGTAKMDGGGGEWGGFELWPYLRANFDNGSYFKVGFLYASGSGTSSGQTAWNGITTGQQSFIAIPITYVWAF